MASPSPYNPLGYIINRQYRDDIVIRDKLFKERLSRARNLYRKDLLGHYGCVNAIEFSDEGELLVSGGDDRRVLLWSVPEAIHGKSNPVVMQTNHLSNIFCLAFDSTNSKIYSGGNDDQVIIHDARTGHLIARLTHRKPVYGLSVYPENDYVLATAGDDGRILMYDIREPPSTDPLTLAKQKTGFHSVMFNPSNTHWLVTANSEEGIALWDYRKPREVLIHYDSNAGQVSGISACFNSNGSHILALRRRLPPVLYDTETPDALCQFYHPQYYNSCTMKTCCFAGDNDEYILSGSDDFNLYMWQIPKDNSEWGPSHVVLHGHRSIVNQVRYNKHNNLIASSGVEKMVKLWSTLPIGNWNGSLLKEHTEPPRVVYSHDDYIYLVGDSGERISHDYSDHSTQEDAKMMAFFDSLIQREIEGWNSPSDVSGSSDSDSDCEDKKYKIWENLLPTRKSEDSKKKPNRIAQLIAQKRGRLAKMAHVKSSSVVSRYSAKEKMRKRKNNHKMKSSKSARTNGTSKKMSSKKSATSPPSKQAVRENLKQIAEAFETKLRKYRTRQSIKDVCDSSTSNNSYDTPSTSTGITSSNNSVYRVIEQDSDDEVPPNNCVESNEIVEDNLVNILPTPLNGTHDMYINVLEMNNANNGNDDYNNGASTSNGLTRAAVADNIDDDDDEEEYCNDEASTSNNGSKCTYVPHNCIENSIDVECARSLNKYVHELKDLLTKRSGFVNDSDSDSEYEYDYETPPMKKRRSNNLSAIDSGCGSGPCTSSGSNRNSRNHPACSNNNGSYNDRSSDEDLTYKKRVKKAKVNLRKYIGADSDSN